MSWYRDLFRIESGGVSTMLFVRVAIAAGVSLRLGHAVFATIAAAFSRLGFALNPAFGYLAFTVFLIMIAELARGGSVPGWTLVLTRVYDVAVGCAIALIARLIASLGNPPPAAQPGAA